MRATLFAACGVLLAVAVPAAAGDAEAGKEKSKVCAACHGADGNSTAPDFPRLAGQHYDYLLRALDEYKTGARKNAIMMPMIEKLTKRDMEDLAAYFSHEKGLVTKY
jgi:cytochrome c553